MMSKGLRALAQSLSTAGLGTAVSLLDKWRAMLYINAYIFGGLLWMQ